MPDFICGLDLGQRQDYTAFIVLEVVSTRLESNSGVITKHIESLDVREAVRFPLGTPYTEIVNDITAAMQKLEWEKEKPKLIIDATNNTALVDYFRQEHRNKNFNFDIVAVSITGGGTASYEKGFHKVPKIHLIQQTQLALEQKLIRFAEQLEFIDLLTRELENYQVTISDSGSEIYNARSREHDDLVLALALPVWFALRFGRDIFVSAPIITSSRFGRSSW